LNFRLWTIALIFLIASAAYPADDIATDEESFSGIYIRADDSEYSYDSQAFRAEGDAFVRYNDIKLTADLVTGDAVTGDFEAVGNVTFSQGDRTVRGQSFKYNYNTKLGHSTDASASVGNIHFHGDELDSKPEGYTLMGSRFTTCDAQKPHYYLSARELIIRPKDKLIARKVRFVALGKTVFSVPKYTVDLSGKQDSGIRLPWIGMDNRHGLFAQENFDLSSKPGLDGELTVRLSMKNTFQGGVKLTRVANRPILMNLTYREPYTDGLNPDTVLSRLPEIAYRFYSKGTLDPYGRSDVSLHFSKRMLDPTRQHQSAGRLHMIGEAGVGYFEEEPSGAESARFDVRGMAWMDPMDVGGTLIMPGVLARVSSYGNGDSYSTLGFQLAAARKLGSRSYVSLTYINHAISGRTPFEFDPVEIPHELAGRFRFPIGDYAIEYGARYDLQANEMFDSEITISKPLHCIEPKLTWRSRAKAFSIGIGLVGF